MRSKILLLKLEDVRYHMLGNVQYFLVEKRFNFLFSLLLWGSYMVSGQVIL